MLNRKSSHALLAAAAMLSLTIVAPASALGQSRQNSSQSPNQGTTNLGTMIVAPQKAPNAASAVRVKLKVKRSALNFGAHGHPAALVQPKAPSTVARPQSAPKQTVTRTPPQPLHVVPPKYPAKAYADRRKGTVTVGFTIAADGTTRDIHVLSSHPAGMFDAAARQAVSQWLFQPATENGKAVSVNVSQTLVFRPPAKEEAAKHAPETPSGEAAAVSPPPNSVPSNIHPTHLVAPLYPPNAYRTGRGGEVTLSFVVGRGGHTRDIRIIQSKPRHIFDTAAKNAVRQWRFKPVEHATKVVQTIHFTPPD